MISQTLSDFYYAARLRCKTRFVHKKFSTVESPYYLHHFTSQAIIIALERIARDFKSQPGPLQNFVEAHGEVLAAFGLVHACFAGSMGDLDTSC